MPKVQRAGRSVMRYDVTLDTLEGDERRVVVYSLQCQLNIFEAGFGIK